MDTPIDLSLVPSGARYEVRPGRGPTNLRFVLVDVTWQDTLVGPYPTRAKAERARAVMQAEADRKAAAETETETEEDEDA